MWKDLTAKPVVTLTAHARPLTGAKRREVALLIRAAPAVNQAPGRAERSVWFEGVLYAESRAECADCGAGPYLPYRLRAGVWAEAVKAGNPRTALCLPCVESPGRLNRHVKAQDLDPAAGCNRELMYLLEKIEWVPEVADDTKA